MKDSKKIKLGKLNFYIIDDNYIKYLSQFDKHIAYNKNEKRPYIGVVIIIEEHYYFAPVNVKIKLIEKFKIKLIEFYQFF